jgi:hypothetical protein
MIDLVLIRNGRPLAGEVFDLGVWSIDDEVTGIEANFGNTGSDHFRWVCICRRRPMR